MKYIVVVLMIVLASVALTAHTAQGGEGTMIAEGKTVLIDYTLTVDGQVIDTSEGKQPLKYVHGEGGIIPGLEKELEGLSVGEQKQVVVAPADGYGEVNAEAVRRLV